MSCEGDEGCAAFCAGGGVEGTCVGEEAREEGEEAVARGGRGGERVLGLRAGLYDAEMRKRARYCQQRRGTCRVRMQE